MHLNQSVSSKRIRDFLLVSHIPGEISSAIDINTTADRVYRHNHPDTRVLNNNIQKFTADAIRKMNVNCILMSPPCQPFTRVGKKKDVDDARANPFIHICKQLNQLPDVQFILIENVKGFEVSQTRDFFIETLDQCKFHYQEFIISPTEIGVPNTRHRYYCLARKSKPFSFQCERLLDKLPGNQSKLPTTIDEFLDETKDFKQYLLSDDVLLKRAWLLDIVHQNSRNSRCFTKAYTHYTEGTGSIYCPHTKQNLDEVYEAIKGEHINDEQKLELLQSLELRYFTPTEVARLMSFPSDFSFPAETTDRQRYRVLGNSINVAVVGKLIQLLMDDLSDE